MSRLSRGQIVGLITIILIFILGTLIFNKIAKNQKQKIDYLTYDKTIPSTLLNGNYLEYVNLGENYKEKGLKTTKDYIITYIKNGQETLKIDTSNFGTYQVKYYMTNEKPIIKTVIIIDKKAPSISVPPKQTITIDEVDTFDLEEGVVATDNSGEVTLTHDNTLKRAKGNYIITYKAKDSSGNETQRKRLIKVK